MIQKAKSDILFASYDFFHRYEHDRLVSKAPYNQVIRYNAIEGLYTKGTAHYSKMQEYNDKS